LKPTIPHVQQKIPSPSLAPSDTIDLGILAAHATLPLDSIPIVTLNDDTAIDYTLQIRIANGPYLTSATDMFDSVPFNSRYRGIIYTTEASPTPIGIIDGPDIGDWQSNELFTPTCAYPNPASKVCELGITIPQVLDSIQGEIFVTPHHAVQTFVDGKIVVGNHEVAIDISSMSPGLYRVLWTAFKNGTETSSHGNIMIPLP
jgi:hypothetical protein